MSKRPPAAMTASRQKASASARHSLTKAQLLEIAEKVVFAPMRERKVFFESPELKTLIGVFHKAVKKHGVLNQQDVIYAKPRTYRFSADQFKRAVEAVMEHAPDTEKSNLTKHDFPVLSKVYEGLKFSVLIGQGSTYFIEAAETKASPKP